MEETRQGRLKGDHEIATRLLILDYLLGQLEHRWLSTDAEKVEYFEKELKIDPLYFPRASASTANGNTTAGRYFPDRFPIAVIQEKPESNVQVRFTFFDAVSATVKAFERYLASYRDLFLRLPKFELVYVSFAPGNFPQAKRPYERMISQPMHKLATQLIQRSHPVFGFNNREKKQSRSGQPQIQLRF